MNVGTHTEATFLHVYAITASCFTILAITLWCHRWGHCLGHRQQPRFEIAHVPPDSDYDFVDQHTFAATHEIAQLLSGSSYRALSMSLRNLHTGYPARSERFGWRVRAVGWCGGLLHTHFFVCVVGGGGCDMSSVWPRVPSGASNDLWMQSGSDLQ